MNILAATVIILNNKGDGNEIPFIHYLLFGIFLFLLGLWMATEIAWVLTEMVGMIREWLKRK
jgi:galactitol-specific phosphotransferase system IIC component